MFLKRRADKDHEALPTIDEEKLSDSQCSMDIELRWQTEVSSSIYATPLIADVDSDGRLDIVVPSFVHYLEVLEGADGEKLPGWPSFHKSSTHSSPLFYDIDRDGEREILLPTYNGQILAFRHNGQLMHEKINIPRFKVRKDWFVGLDPDHVDHHHPDIHAPIIENSTLDDEVKSISEELLNLPKKTSELPPNLGQYEKNNSSNGSSINGTDCTHDLCSAKHHSANLTNHPLPRVSDSKNSGFVKRNVNEVNSSHNNHNNSNHGINKNRFFNSDSTDIYFMLSNELEKALGILIPENDRILHDQWSMWYNNLLKSNRSFTHSETEHVNTHIHWVKNVIERSKSKKIQINTQNQIQNENQNQNTDLNQNLNQNAVGTNQDVALSANGFNHSSENESELKSSTARRLLQVKEEEKKENNEATVEKEGELDEDGDRSWKVFEDYDDEDEKDEKEDDKEDENDENLDDVYDDEYDDYNADRMWGDEEWDEETNHEKNKDMIDIDSHILCTPTIADIDKDGVDEMVIATSYFFDRDYYDDPAHHNELADDVDLGKYLAGAIVVMNLETMQVKWHIHLELTTDSTRYRAYIYSAPTVVDLDGDGWMEIIVGTSVGFIYVIDAFGNSREGFPVQMGEIQGQVAVSDINDDGEMEIVAADTLGNVAAFSSTGKLIWERHTASLIAQGVTVGDVDGDGETDVAFGTTSGHVWVLNGHTGEDVHGFPYRTHGRVMAPILLVDLKKEKGAGLHLALTSFDGYFYVIDGKTICANAIDIGETSYTMVLADNVDGGDDLDLIVSTMNGNVFCFQTPALYHPLKAWSSQNQVNVFSPRYSNRGVYILPSSRQYRDINAKSFKFQFEIVDALYYSSKAKEARLLEEKSNSPSKTNLSYSVTIRMLMPGVNEIIYQKEFKQPGIYTTQVLSPLKRTHVTILVDMIGPHQQHFNDEVSFTFHHNFYRLFKWIIALPLLAMAFSFILKSFSVDKYQNIHLPSFSPSR